MFNYVKSMPMSQHEHVGVNKISPETHAGNDFLVSF